MFKYIWCTTFIQTVCLPQEKINLNTLYLSLLKILYIYCIWVVITLINNMFLLYILYTTPRQPYYRYQIIWPVSLTSDKDQHFMQDTHIWSEFLMLRNFGKILLLPPLQNVDQRSACHTPGSSVNVKEASLRVVTMK